MYLISYFPQIDGTKITIGTATRSSSGGTPNNIVDGNTGTTDVQLSGEYWELDLGSVKDICKIRLYPTSGFYSFRLSETGAFAGEEYFTHYIGGGGNYWDITNNQWNDYYVNPITKARYIRVYLEANATLNEVEIYETAESAFGILTSDCGTFFDGAKDTVDEQNRRRWLDKLITSTSPSTPLSVNKYVQLDLGSVKTIGQINTYLGDTGQYSVKVSTTGVFGGEEVVVVNSATRASDWYYDTNNLPYDARYIRILAHSTFKLREFDVLYEPYGLYDIENDFRTIGEELLVDVDNDFRTLGAVLSDIVSDFRMIGDIEIKDIVNDCRTVLEVLSDINNKFNTVIAPSLKDMLNKFNMCNRTIGDVMNRINTVGSQLKDIINDFRTIKLVQSNVKNDFRLIATWQIPGDAGFQSLGKEYVKVYIDSVEQTDAIIDSVSITKAINSTHTASFELGRPYDDTKPDMEAPVEIRYYKGNWSNYWLLYKGYIVDILPTSNPESIKISCQNKYWKQNKTKKYFFVGHKPQDDYEKYYNTIKEALATECSFDIDIGDFIPQTISCFGQGESECISSLIQSAGNFGWYYDESENKKLRIAGQGDIIDLERQSIGTNVGLYQVIRNQFRESIENIVNKLRVQMGEEVIREFDEFGGVKTYTGYNYTYYQAFPVPVWGSAYEKLAKYSSDGYGLDSPKPGEEDLYNRVFRVYSLPYLDPKTESWTDKYPPVIEVYQPGWWTPFLTVERIYEGFTIDYENGQLILDEPFYVYHKDSDGQVTAVRGASLFIKIWKKKYYSYTVSPTENPEEDVSNPLMFFTDKMGDYSETILGFLDLSGLSIQEGSTYVDANGDIVVVPSWDDTEFAEDYADWQLSKTCDKKINGSIDITLDAFCFHNIDLSKRIMIEGVIENPLNIDSITLNLSNFLATISLKNPRYYKRSVSLQSRGE